MELEEGRGRPRLEHIKEIERLSCEILESGEGRPRQPCIAEGCTEGVHVSSVGHKRGAWLLVTGGGGGGI